METNTLLIDCPDEKGLIHRITKILHQNDLNIEYQGEFVDSVADYFYMRTTVSGALDRQKVVEELRSEIRADARIQLQKTKRKDVVLLVTKEPHCLGDILLRHFYDELPARILGVVSNHETLRPLVEKFNIPYHCIPHQGLGREEHESRLLDCISQYKPEYLVLAKYMRILQPQFVAQFPSKIINIHHSFLPAFIGAKPYHQAYQRGVKIIGATAHFVTENLDEGPIIAQNVIPVDHSKSEHDMIRAGRNVEMTVLAEALRLVFEDRVFVHGNRTVVFD